MVFLCHVTMKGGSHDVSYEVLGAGTGSWNHNQLVHVSIRPMLDGSRGETKGSLGCAKGIYGETL